MATNEQLRVIGTYFDLLRCEITSSFAILHEILDEKQATLIIKLSAIKEQFDQSSELVQGINALKLAKENCLAALKGNIIGEAREKIAKTFDDQIDDVIKNNLSLINSRQVKLRCFITKIQEDISEIDLVEELPLYSTRVAPILKAGKIGSGPGEISGGSGISYDDVSNTIYIANVKKNSINVFTGNGEFLREFGSLQINQPLFIALDDNFVFVSDKIQNCVHKFEKNGSFLKKIGSKGDGQLEFNAPYGMSARGGFVYICDFANNRVQIFTNQLEYANSVSDERLKFPCAIYTNQETIYLLGQLESCSNKIFLFERLNLQLLNVIQLTGQEYKMQIHLFFTIDREGNYLISSPLGNSIKIFDKNGVLRNIIGAGHLVAPTGIALDNDDNIICLSAGSLNKPIQKY